MTRPENGSSLPTLGTCDESRAPLSELSVLGWEGAEAAASPPQGCEGSQGMGASLVRLPFSHRPGDWAPQCHLHTDLGVPPVLLAVAF